MMMTQKKCNECGVLKDFKYFVKDKNRQNGITARCKECRNKYLAIWNLINADKKLQNGQRYLKNHPEKRKESSLKYYNKIKNDPIQMVKRRGISRKWSKTFRGRLMRTLAEERRRKYILGSDDGTITYESVMQMYNNQNGKSAISGEDLNHKFHIDHIRPLCLGGKHTLSNIQLILPIENLRKGVKIESK